MPKELATFTKALNSKTEFTNKEWDAFGINDLHTEHYIQADNGLFYQPASATDEHIQPIRVAFPHKTVADVFFGILAPHTASQPQIVPGSHCALIVYSVVSYWHSKGGMKAHRLIIDFEHGALLQQPYGTCLVHVKAAGRCHSLRFCHRCLFAISRVAKAVAPACSREDMCTHTQVMMMTRIPETRVSTAISP